MDINLVVLKGVVSRDVVLKTTQSGKEFAMFSLETKYTRQDGDSYSQYHEVVLWGDKANVAKPLKKGDGVFIKGALQTRSWEGQDGKKNYRTEVVATDCTPLTKTEPTSSSKEASPYGQSVDISEVPW